MKRPMTKLTDPGQSIEGKKIDGQSRRPLVNRGIELQNGITVYKFVANFDVRAELSQALQSGKKPIIEEASVSQDDEVICETAIVYSVDPRYSKQVRKGSASHKTNMWYFKKQTAVRVSVSHQSIALAKTKDSNNKLNKTE